jgi:hypothetical protein
MAFVPSVELRTDPNHSFSPPVPFHSVLTGSSTLDSNLVSNEYLSLKRSLSIINNTHIDQTIGI